MSEPRESLVNRKTLETEVNISFSLDGEGVYFVNTGQPFFDHMLELFCKHSSFNMELTARGDLAVDGHHTVEDVGLCLGLAIKRALGEKHGIKRYGHAIIPMDEALAMVAVDLSGRGFLAFDAPMPAARVGEFETELVQEFFRALAISGEFTLHIRLLAGTNTHHIIEAIFKGLARVLKDATTYVGGGIPSTKGEL
ncbi:Imidazoleglycerol-phosphate dehydratase [Pelotomaculum sp. FP]|uniref:imidazoleglycerol-phosphate dehydratase HisB n=1 Tax=Pelotomaculum sp. FP TaxID=261474 RepID=UPI0010668DF0|nr:imidazoleglycerol-phosphate dehydratase HisB [Pelotomaculum sp. FP]TEB16138.1 Imidazoleglycerol-phosphate dehydratase [Pelotomaculum sp. FP]